MAVCRCCSLSFAVSCSAGDDCALWYLDSCFVAIESLEKVQKFFDIEALA